ncbi:hypothetical protein QAD02_023520 [Eretmocerus hayati]|uniref:Uncharacterized protein n=1 Tax=Eretmocerus hayati TaxID=131215 RepID=A0ACC2PW21_9HYME|nr:hypothetical protein QAD02_023520 [Eretmocerus hayati]
MKIRLKSVTLIHTTMTILVALQSCQCLSMNITNRKDPSSPAILPNLKDEPSTTSTSTALKIEDGASNTEDDGPAGKDVQSASAWECPEITGREIECSCDLPHTLRCTGDSTALQVIEEQLRRKEDGKPQPTISLLDVTATGLSALPADVLRGVALHGLVLSTGELRRLNERAFSQPLLALGLPNNLLDAVPTSALSRLPSLQRLDLSHNKLRSLEATAFYGLSNVTYLDLSGNQLSQLTAQALVSMPGLKNLKLRGNRLQSGVALSALRGLRNLEELDLSSNRLNGPLGPSVLPQMPKLRYLSLAENEIKNVQQGALMGLKNLSSLCLSNNQIDVLEDHAFRHLSSLQRLELAYNNIVAVSSSSLAHLDKLKYLDLTHNYLRSLTADLVVPLRSLEDLRLDDNDITMLTNDLPLSKLRLKSLSLAENPLNCDCSLAEFAKWLAGSSLDDRDKFSAVCATPPALENGVLAQVPSSSLLCGGGNGGSSGSGTAGEVGPSIMTSFPLATAQLTLTEFHFEESTGVDLLWRVDPCNERYTCDTLMVYESTDNNKLSQIASRPIHCDSRLMNEPCNLPISLPTSLNLQQGHRYQYCIVIMLPNSLHDIRHGIGCSEVIELHETVHLITDDDDDDDNSNGDKRQTADGSEDSGSRYRSEITNLHVNVSADGYLKVEISLSRAPVITSSSNSCLIELDVLAAETGKVHREILNCTSFNDGITKASTSLSGLVPGRYRVCANFNNHENEDSFSTNESRLPRVGVGTARCVELQTFRQSGPVPLVALILLGVMLCACCALAILGTRSLLLGSGAGVAKNKNSSVSASSSSLDSSSQQLPGCCFVPTADAARELDLSRKAHYVKLKSLTTKL